MEIENVALRFSCHPASGRFLITGQSEGYLLSCEGRLDGGGGEATSGPCTHPRFGAGQAIAIRQADGGEVSLELYPELPFALLRRTVRNGGRELLDLPCATVANLALDLGRPPAALCTLGTGGLLPPDENPGSYALLACADPETRRGVVAGWVSQDRGSGVLFSSVKDGRVDFKAQIDYGHLRIPPGESAELETLSIGLFDDARIGLERYADAVKRYYAIALRPRQATYCTWYADENGGAGSEASTIELARFIAQELKDFGLEVIQIDDKWQDGPALDGPTRGFEQPRPNGPYPRGFGAVHAETERLGLTLGLWWIPFGRNHADPAWADRQDWFARWADGTPMKTRAFGGTCLDLTHPAVQEHLATLARRYREWGMTYFKMDGLWTGTATELTYICDGYLDEVMSNVAPFHDPSKTQIEAYRDGLRLIREQAGGDVFFSGCAVSQNMRSFGGSFGLVDAMRIGPDFNHDKLGIKTGPIRASRLYFLNGRVWWNDPDPTKVRASDAASAADSGASGAVTLDLARLTTSFTATTGQFFLLSDWLPKLPPERIEVLRRTMHSHDAEVRPIDYFDRFLPALWLLADAAGGVQRQVLGLFNWEKETQTLGETLAKSGLDPQRTYHAFDFWENRLLPDVRGAFTYELPPESCRIVALRADEGRPVLLSTSRHITQGVIDVIKERWEDATLSGASKVIGGDPYELRIRLPEGWTPDKVEADVPADTAEEPGLLRITLRSPETQEIAWSAAFAN